MWFELTSWDVSRLKGTLMNTARGIPDLKEGAEVEIPESQIFDYKWYKADGSVEGNLAEKARDNKKGG